MADVEQEVEELIKKRGMKRVLESLIEYVDKVNPDNIVYLTILSDDLKAALKNYVGRHDILESDKVP